MLSTAKVIKISDAMAWIEGEGAIALRAITRDGEAVMLDPEQARRVARGLNDLADALDSVLRERTREAGADEA